MSHMRIRAIIKTCQGAQKGSLDYERFHEYKFYRGVSVNA